MRTRLQVSYNQMPQVMFCGDSFQAKVENFIERQKQHRIRPERRWRREEARKMRRFRR